MSIWTKISKPATSVVALRN